MFDFHFKRPGRLALGVAVAVGALTLAACGSSNNNTGGTVPPITSNPLPVVSADLFINVVKALITKTDETSEPGQVLDVAVTTPENTEPDPTP
ncbi:MAG: hypothetical protein M3Y65_22885 [Pseudomonadota bacterium]|nr:hypothetical protein [Pseudomonadota bacterium]